MSSSDFRQIAVRGERGKKERLFRAAVTAFCSLTRPSRNEIAQLEDLVLPLYDSVSVEARRYVAAALSEVRNSPAALVARLADELPDIAAPLLLRSNALTDIDLIALIGRHGLGHARVIAKRPNLNPTIAQLVGALLKHERSAVPTIAASRDRPMTPAPLESVENRTPEQFQEKWDPVFRPELRKDKETEHFRDSKKSGNALSSRLHGIAADEIRARLRAMMQPAAQPAIEVPQPADEAPRPAANLSVAPKFGPPPGLYARLRDTALTGVGAFFETALADALGIDFRQAQSIREGVGLLQALKFLELPEEQAFVIVAALYPLQFGHAEAIRLFLERYRLTHKEAAADHVRGWKEATLATALSRPEHQPAQPTVHEPANSPGFFGKALRAS